MYWLNIDLRRIFFACSWHSNLERTLWLQYVSGVVRAASVVARAVAGARPVLVHCSDGWDRTPQIVAAAQLILDPYYRTLEVTQHTHMYKTIYSIRQITKKYWISIFYYLEFLRHVHFQFNCAY